MNRNAKEFLMKKIQDLRGELKIKQIFLGTQHPSTADTMFQLGEAWQELGVNDFAEKYYYEALKVRLEVFGPDHPTTGASLWYLAKFYRDCWHDEERAEFYFDIVTENFLKYLFYNEKKAN